MASESELQKKFTSLLTKENVPYIKTHGGIVYTPVNYASLQKTPTFTFKGEFRIKKLQSGWTDLIVFEGNGDRAIPIFIELKSDRGKLRVEQDVKMAKLSFMGFKSIYILKPSQWNELKSNYKLNKNLDMSFPLKTALELTGCFWKNKQSKKKVKNETKD